MKELLKHFMSKLQRECLKEACKGEEAAYFKQLLLRLASHIVSMPKTYETDGQGDQVIVQLHYFLGGSDWWITERDMELREQYQAFGYACLNGDVEMAELGFINIEEIIALGAELDLHFKPTTLGDIRTSLRRRYRQAVAEPLNCCTCLTENLLQPCEACPVGKELL